MKIDVVSEKENPLLERKEVVVKISYKGASPKREEIRSKLIAKLNADDDRLVLDPLQQKYGAAETVAKVKVYSSKKRVREIESPHIIRKNFPGEVPAPEVKEKPTEQGKKAEPKETAKEADEKVEKGVGQKEAPKTAEEKPEDTDVKEGKEKAPKQAREKPKEVEEKPQPAEESKTEKPETKEPEPKAAKETSKKKEPEIEKPTKNAKKNKPETTKEG